jgi:hypothetical protein
MTRRLLALLVLAHPGDGRAADPPGPKLKWPDVKGLERQPPVPAADQKFGYSVSYSGGSTVAVVFVYNAGRERIPDGPDSDAAKAEMYESLLVLEANRTGRKPRYKSLTPLDEGVIPFGSDAAAPQVRRKRYEADVEGEGAAVTELYVTGYKDYFIKIRATYPVADKEKGQKHLSALLDGLGAQLK